MTDKRFPLCRSRNGRALPAVTIEDAVGRCLKRATRALSGCLEIKGAAQYPTQDLDQKQWRASRLVWTLANGPIPDGFVVRHKCDNSFCIELAHLEVGTMSDNMKDAVQRKRHNNIKKTHCRKGHPYDESNTSVASNGRGRNPRRYCLRCCREKQRRIVAEKRRRGLEREKEREGL